jgi:hypothetical protein
MSKVHIDPQDNSSEKGQLKKKIEIKKTHIPIFNWADLQCSALTGLDERRLQSPPPPIDWVLHACYHLPTQYSITISKLKFQTYFEIILNGYFLRLMCVHTTNDIYFTLRIKFLNLSINFCEIVTYPLP